MNKHTKKTGSGMRVALTSAQVPEWVNQLYNQLQNIMQMRANNTPSTFAPDLVALNNHLCTLPAKDMVTLRNYVMKPHPYQCSQVPETLLNLMNLENILEYDTYAQSVARKLYSYAENPGNVECKELLKFFVGYIAFVFNGTQLIFDEPNQPLCDIAVSDIFDPYNSVKAIDLMMDDKSAVLFKAPFNAELLVILMTNLPIEARVKIKMTVGLPLSDEERRAVKQNRSLNVPIKTMWDVIELKEKFLFNHGPWTVSTVLIFPRLKLGAPINYSELKMNLQRMMEDEGNPFCRIKIKKNVELETRLTGTRHLTINFVGRQRWEFTDPLEVRVLNQYFSIHNF